MATLGLTVLFAVIVAISAIVGLARGFGKTVIRIITLVLAAIGTFLIAGPVTTYLAQNIRIEGLTLGETLLAGLRSSEMMHDLLATTPALQEAVLVLPAFVMSVIVFPVVFTVLSFVSWIVYLIVNKPLCKLFFRGNREKEGNGIGFGSRLGGLGVGIVTGALIFSMIMTPTFGLLSTLPAKNAMDNTLNTMVEQEFLSAADAESIQGVYAVTDCPLVNFYSRIGITSAGRSYINSVSQFQSDGQTVCLADELDALLSGVQTAMEHGLLNKLMAAEDPNALYSLLADKAFMDALMQDMLQSKLLRAAIPEVMAIAMESAANSMGVPANKDAVYNNMMDDIAMAVKNAGIDYAAIEAYEQAHSIVYMYARSYIPVRTDTAATQITPEAYEAEIEKLEELIKTISSILNKAISGDNEAFTDSVADHIVSEVKAQASEGGQSVLDNFDSASVQSTLAGIDSADIDAGDSDADKLLEQLTDQEKFETDVATVETITDSIRESVKKAMADDTKAAETATTLANVVSDFAGAVASATDENGKLDASKLDYEKIASAVTTLQNSSLKDVGSTVLDIVASGELGKNSMVGDMVEAVKEGYEKGEDIGGTINTAGALINLGSAMNNQDENGHEGMVDSLTSLINNLNDYTISLLPSILSADTITSMGVPAKYADTTYTVIETLLKELMKLKGAEDYNNEVNSILSLYNLATAGVDQFTKDDIVGLVGYAIESDAIFNTLMSISTSNPFGIQIQDEATRLDLVNAIEENFAQSGQTQRERDIYNAVATLLGLDAEVNLG